MFPGLSVATTITVLTSVSCYYMTSLNYGGKMAKDEGLTCRFHLSNIIPDSIFYDSMKCGMTHFFPLEAVIAEHRKDGLSLIYITPVGVGNLKLFFFFIVIHYMQG